MNLFHSSNLSIYDASEGKIETQPSVADCAEFDDLLNAMMDEFEAEHDNSTIERTQDFSGGVPDALFLQLPCL
jgi:hypothetical protein